MYTAKDLLLSVASVKISFCSSQYDLQFCCWQNLYIHIIVPECHACQKDRVFFIWNYYKIPTEMNFILQNDYTDWGFMLGISLNKSFLIWNEISADFPESWSNFTEQSLKHLK